MLIGEGEYNINDMKEIRGSKSFLGLDQHVRECQNEEPFFTCTTRQYFDTILERCGCVPFNIRLSNQV